MTVRTRLPMFVLAAALLGLIAVLATLQYRWLGQVSTAERERMQANLAARATGFATDFDREIARAYLTFQLDPLESDANVATHVSARFDRWLGTSRYPRLIRDVYIAARVDGDEATVQRFNPSTKFLEPAGWPPELQPIRQTLAPTPPDPRPGATVVVRTMPPAVWPSIPALVVPAPMLLFRASAGTMLRDVGEIKGNAPSVSFVVLVLDRDYISSEMMPAIAQQHFRGAGETIDYDLAVVGTASTGPVYSTRSSFSPDPAAPSDAAADLLQVRLQDFGELASEVRRFTSFISTRVGRPTGARREQGIAIREAPLSLVLQHGAIDKRAVETTVASTMRATASAPHWRLIVKHPSGSLEAAVAQVRRRNLFISSGILAVLGLSVGFLVMTTRRAQELARQQMEFVAAVSHELRTPLAVIRSAADNLAEGVVTEDPRVKRYGDLVRGEGRRLSEMVEQILELAGIHSGQRGFVLVPVAVLPLLRDVVDASRTLLDEAKLQIEYDMPDALPPVLGDEQALRRLFQNLVVNAIKYGAAGGWIGLKARVSGREVAISVADRGAGIDAAEQAKIFEPFYRAPAAIAAQVQGAGLGLNLVQRIVEAHGGRITVRSAPGQGSEFTVHLPAASEEPAPRTARVANAAGTSA
jgi:signal transduction histidine kinase